MIDERLKEMGITLPEPPAPAGSYVPVVLSGNTAYVSGQIPVKDGKVAYSGKVSEANAADARESAKLCAINIMAQLRRELGDLDRITKIVRLGGFVNSGPDFTAHPDIINAASDLMHEVFGQSGRHARAAVGVSSLPMDAMTEIDAVAEFR